jgi:hypothetical protein
MGLAEAIPGASSRLPQAAGSCMGYRSGGVEAEQRIKDGDEKLVNRHRRQRTTASSVAEPEQSHTA